MKFTLAWGEFKPFHRKSLDFIAFTGYTGLNDICIKIGGFFT